MENEEASNLMDENADLRHAPENYTNEYNCQCNEWNARELLMLVMVEDMELES